MLRYHIAFYLPRAAGDMVVAEALDYARRRTALLLRNCAMLENARPGYIAMSLQMLAEFYYGMSMAILVAPVTDHFITSDSPTVWYNPEAYKWPPFWRSPGLAQESVEVTIPLTPQYALFLSHNHKITGYRQLSAKLVQEFNRRTRFHCDQWFVSWQGEVREVWFDAGTPPEDRWGDSPEGKRAPNSEIGMRSYCACMRSAVHRMMWLDLADSEDHIPACEVPLGSK